MHITCTQDLRLQQRTSSCATLHDLHALLNISNFVILWPLCTAYSQTDTYGRGGRWSSVPVDILGTVALPRKAGLWLWPWKKGRLYSWAGKSPPTPPPPLLPLSLSPRHANCSQISDPVWQMLLICVWLNVLFPYVHFGSLCHSSLPTVILL